MERKDMAERSAQICAGTVVGMVTKPTAAGKKVELSTAKPQRIRSLEGRSPSLTLRGACRPTQP
jgi:hypothetical protein